MPEPEPNKETKEEFIERCIPIVIEEGTAEDGKQARAICEKYWEEGQGDNNMKSKAFQSPFKRGKPGYTVQNKIDGPTEVYIYDEIGFFGVEAETFVKDLKELKGEVLVRINSPGGSVWDGMAIYNAIKERKDTTNTVIDGIAASAASYIALAGDDVRMAEGAFLMIHEPWSLVVGNSEDMRKEADLLDKVNDQIAGFYARKSGKSLDEVKDMMREETWLPGKDAKEAGFANTIVDETPAENLFDLSVFNNVPEKLSMSSDGDTPTRKNIEEALRQAGLSRQAAKAFYASGKEALKEPENIDSDEAWAMIEQLKTLIKE